MPFLTSGRSRFIGGGRVPPAPVPVAGAELIVNGDFEGTYVAGVAPGWSLTSIDVVLSEENSVIHGGAAAQKAVTSSATLAGITQATTGKMSTGAWYAWSTWSYRVAPNGSLSTQLYDGVNVLTLPDAALTTNAWVNQLLHFRSGGTGGYVRQRNYFAAQTFYSDDFSLKALTLSSLISTRPYASADCDISVAVTRTAGTQAGIAVRVDDPANPQNFIIAYLDGAGNCKVDKCVAGTYTNVISGAVTYGAGYILRLVCNGNNVSCYYNGTQVGSTTAVADAGIVGNKNHGLFSTYAANTFTGYVAA